jgi:hypothetical protein
MVAIAEKGGPGPGVKPVFDKATQKGTCVIDGIGTEPEIKGADGKFYSIQASTEAEFADALGNCDEGAQQQAIEAAQGESLIIYGSF